MTPIRLFCFPHAGGGGAFFRGWGAALQGAAEVVPVVRPGREARYREAPYRCLHSLVDATLAELDPMLDVPYAFFGHSLGALIAYDVCRHVIDEGRRRAPLALLVSGRRPPHLAARQIDVHALPRDEFVMRVGALNGIPPEVLGDRELMDALLPTIRADFELHEGYVPVRRPRLDVPVAAMLGADDPLVGVGEMLGWRDVTCGQFSLRVFSGDHFYLRDARPEPLSAVRAELSEFGAHKCAEQRLGRS